MQRKMRGVAAGLLLPNAGSIVSDALQEASAIGPFCDLHAHSTNLGHAWLAANGHAKTLLIAKEVRLRPDK
jgi:hypothetical protein